MNPVEAKEVIDLLARGIAPTTGEILPEDGPLSDVRVVRALLLASDALASPDGTGVQARTRPAAGRYIMVRRRGRAANQGIRFRHADQ